MQKTFNLTYNSVVVMVTQGQLSVCHHTNVWPPVSGGLSASKTLGIHHLKNPQMVNSETPSGPKILFYCI